MYLWDKDDIQATFVLSAVSYRSQKWYVLRFDWWLLILVNGNTWYLVLLIQ